MCSANDAASVIAWDVAGSIPAFVQQMNARAAELGLTNTHFENACGLDAAVRGERLGLEAYSALADQIHSLLPVGQG